MALVGGKRKKNKTPKQKTSYHHQQQQKKPAKPHNPEHTHTHKKVRKPPIAFLTVLHIEFISSPKSLDHFSEWSIFLWAMTSSRFLSRNLCSMMLDQKSCYREKLLLQFFHDDLCSWVLRNITVQLMNSSFCSFFQHTVSTEIRCHIPPTTERHHAFWKYLKSNNVFMITVHLCLRCGSQLT